MQPTNTQNPAYFHKVVDCQWACPAHTPVPEYIRLIGQGRYSDAYMINWVSNVFPGVLGRVCDRPCEPACRRGRVEENNGAKPEAVAICRLKRVAADNKDSVATFVAALLPAEEHQHLLLLKEKLELAKQQAVAVLNVARSKWLDLEKNQPLPNPPLPGEGVVPALVELEALLTALETERRTLSEQLGAQRALLTSDEQRRLSQQALFAEIATQTADTDIWQRLDSLIGSARGDKFRKFAQGLTLDHLLHLANRHLARLHGRYLLRRKSTGELELDIIDSWQGDTARDTRTLSGGESFLVSLALALALSDLVSHKTSIDSLFLDEGFGTLDADTLEIALNALDSLNSSGKMIGVISHVDGMKERIAAQICVSKGGGVGHSRLVVPGSSA